MLLLDSSIVMEAAKGREANAGVRFLLTMAGRERHPLYVTSLLLGELRCQAERARGQQDTEAAIALGSWVDALAANYPSMILPFDAEAARVWGRLCAEDPSHPIDKQVAAIALAHDFELITRHTARLANTGVRLYNPFFENS